MLGVDIVRGGGASDLLTNIINLLLDYNVMESDLCRPKFKYIYMYIEVTPQHL